MIIIWDYQKCFQNPCFYVAQFISVHYSKKKFIKCNNFRHLLSSNFPYCRLNNSHKSHMWGRGEILNNDIKKIYLQMDKIKSHPTLFSTVSYFSPFHSEMLHYRIKYVVNCILLIILCSTLNWDWIIKYLNFCVCSHVMLRLYGIRCVSNGMFGAVRPKPVQSWWHDGWWFNEGQWITVLEHSYRGLFLPWRVCVNGR